MNKTSPSFLDEPTEGLPKINVNWIFITFKYHLLSESTFNKFPIRIKSLLFPNHNNGYQSVTEQILEMAMAW